MKDNRERKNVEIVADMLNDFSFNPEKFCEAMTMSHRTLQQSFTRLCIHWLCTCADDNYRYDGRNEASHRISKALIDSQDADFIGNIPFI